MKKMKKILALLITMVMVLGMSTSVFAASITITSTAPENAEDNTEYTYYEIFKASIAGDNVVYYIPVSTAGTALKNLVDAVTITKGEGDDATTIDVFSFKQSADGSRWNVTINSAIDATTDGEAIANALNTAAIKAAALASGDFAQEDGTAVADELDPGYYLVTSSLGTKLVLQTLNDVTINTKNSYPTNSKSASKVNLNVGDQITYTITVSIPASATVGETVTVHDTLDAHLAILDSSNAIATAAANYNITAAVGTTSVTLADATAAEGETFAKSFTITNAMLGQDVVITYKAELLSTAADDTGYVNEAVTNYSDYETVPTTVKVYTFDFDLDKNFSGVAAADADDYEATFELRTGSATGTAISFVEVSETEGEGDDAVTTVTGYVKADSNDTGTTTTLTVTGGDSINISGLAAGTYYLVETSTADGFNQLTDPVVVTITDTTTGTQPNITPSHTVSYVIGDGDAATGTVTVVNQAGSVLPSTGGIGTTIFYIIGAILVIGAGVVLVTRRRMNAQ